MPTLFAIYISFVENDLDGVIECQPHLITTITSIVKLLSLYLNRQNLKKIFISVKEEWDLLEVNGTVHILDEITRKGSKIAEFYRGVLLPGLLLFLLLPLVHPVLDIIMPLNETRPRQQVFKLYYFVDSDENFYPIYFHASFCSIAAILSVITVDSLYMIIAHHASGLFAVCGHKIKKSTENNGITNGLVAIGGGYEDARECVEAHNKAIQFFEFLDKISRKNFLLQIGFNMIGVSVTAFQVVVHLDELNEAIRHAIFFGAQNIHLFFLSLPGQIITDYSSEVANNMYSSEWYHTPVKIQKVLHTLQMRSSKPCELTAGGLYKMNMENFGKILSVNCYYVVTAIQELHSLLFRHGVL
ncbi:odorant receptor Or2-like [Colletes latitarsis]|uniref:odorant receptor Or2-like n=1 Tax=Colletes latitarsis TaxID=2605962 RepID=UPI0040369AED